MTIITDTNFGTRSETLLKQKPIKVIIAVNWMVSGSWKGLEETVIRSL